MTASLRGQRSSVQVLWVPQSSLEHIRVTGERELLNMPGRWHKCRTRAGCKPSALSVARAHFSATVEAAAGEAGSSHHDGRQLRRMEHHSHAKGVGVSGPFKAPTQPCLQSSRQLVSLLPIPLLQSQAHSVILPTRPVPLLMLNLLPEMPSQPKFSPSSNKAVLPLL